MISEIIDLITPSVVAFTDELRDETHLQEGDLYKATEEFLEELGVMTSIESIELLTDMLSDHLSAFPNYTLDDVIYEIAVLHEEESFKC